MKNWFKKYLWIVQLVTLLVGCIFALLAGFFAQNRFGQSLLSVGIALISSGLLAVLNKFFGTDVSSIVEQTLDFEKKIVGTGLEEVHLDRLDSSLSKKFHNARYIDLLFNTGANFFNSHSETIKNAICNGSHIRLLIANPGNKYWHNNEITNGLCPTTNIHIQLRDVFKELNKILTDLSKFRPKGSLEIKVYSCISTNSMIIIDNFVRYSPYLPYLNTANIPMYDVSKERGGKLYSRYKQAFENIWKHNDTKPLLKKLEAEDFCKNPPTTLQVEIKDNEFDSYELLNAASIQGLEMMYQNRKEAMTVFANYIREENEEVVMIGSSLLGLKILCDFDLLFSTNPKIFKILLINPDYITTRAASANRNETGIKIEIKETINKLLYLKIPKENIKLFNGTPTVFMIKTSKRMLINPYTYSNESYNCICFQVNSSGTIYKHFEEYHYKKIWDSPCCTDIDVLEENCQRENLSIHNLLLKEAAPAIETN